MLYFLIVIGTIVLGLIIWLAFIDGSYYVTRSTELNVSKEKAFELISDFKSWKSWSPWLCMEPNAKVNITNGGTGVGACNSWVGELVGSGEIEHTKIKTNQSIDQEIRFIKPFKSRSDVFWKFEGNDNSSIVTWGMKGKMPFFFKFMAKNMEPWIGMDYERGLKMIKDLLENEQINSSIKIDGQSIIPATHFIGLKAQCPMNEVGESMKNTFNTLNEYSEKQQIESTKALSVYHDFNFTKPNCEYSAGICIAEASPVNHNQLYNGHISEQKAIKVTFTGDYKHLGNAWSAAYAYARYKKLKVKKSIDPVEFYLNDPKQETDPAKWETEVYLPIK